MRYSTASGMVMAALSIGEAVAGPAHAHLHRKIHEKKDVDWATLNWDDMGIDWSSAWAAGQATKTSAAVAEATAATVATTTAAAVVAATTSAAAAKATASSSSLSTDLSSLIDDVELLFDSLVGISNTRTSFGSSTAASGSTGDNYLGNVGSPYAANIMKVSSAADYDYTITFTNTKGSGMTVNVWQKVGPDMQLLSGSALAPKNTSLTMYLAKGASQTVAFQENTQIGWAEACSDLAESGAYATTWGEANFVSTGSGYDVSAIMNPNNNNYDMTITSEEAPACTSSRTENMWLTATDPVGTSDGSCYIAQSSAHLTVEMGGTV
ncbi:related to Allergen Asp f 4 [Phialocephala subalpina]|uniref:Related to Allergen Asp f 4 n=1 Tax=Phialocephala subalpina TaxID=576137 RepID=A0A1L7WR86_9HELO|nr:related to Allergen Asp f 4 [Phialocephala subalpina]